jgi:hypothetical protein
MVLRRYTITVADLKSGIERRATIAVWAVCAVIAALIALPLGAAVATAWKANGEMQRLSARHRALEIETANYRAALESLLTQVGSEQSTSGDGRAESVQAQPVPLDSTATAAVAGDTQTASVPPISVSAVPESPTPPVADGSVIDDSSARPAPTQAVDAGPVATDAPAAERDDTTDATRREALDEALVTLTQARVLADVAEAGALASRSYEAGVTLELEARQLTSAGRVSDALARAVEAAARFRAAAIEARAEASAAAAWERLSLSEVPTTPTTPARPPGSEGPEPLPSSPAAVEEMIREVIAQYVRGLESRNLATLKRVWPSLGGTQERAIQTEFANARTVQTQFTDPRITINGDITTVTGYRMYSLVTQDGQRLSSVTRTTMTLRRNGDAWLIERVVHQQ